MRYAVVTRCVPILCAIACGAGPATAQTGGGLRITDQRAAVQAYVSASPLATVADDVCPGMQADVAKLQALRAIANVFDKEEDAAFREMKKVEAEARQSIADGGAAAWCRDVWSLIGTNGSWVPGLLTR